MRSFLHVSDHCPVPSLHFILGELTMEARLHRDVFSLFWCVWNNPQTKIHQVVRHLLTTSSDNSRTWSIHLRHLARMYGIPDPLALLQEEPWKKETWKDYIKTKITAFHEKQLRTSAESNSKMAWFNVSVTGLTGRHHPVLNGAVTAHDVKKLRPMVRMLTGDYYCFAVKSDQSGGGDYCRLCPDRGPDLPRPREDIQHIVTECEATRDTRERLLINLWSSLEQVNKDPSVMED